LYCDYEDAIMVLLSGGEEHVLLMAATDGSIPLHTAIRKHNTSRAELLMELAADSLKVQCTTTSLFPFQIAASYNDHDYCFQLLQMEPDLIVAGLTKEKTAIFETSAYIQGAKLHLEASRMRSSYDQKVAQFKKQLREEEESLFKVAARLCSPPS
jgi:hypothetical protein